MKRFLVFIFKDYYSTREENIEESIDTPEELRKLINEKFNNDKRYNYINFIDTKTKETIGYKWGDNFTVNFKNNGFIKEEVDNVYDAIQKILDKEKEEVE